MTLELAISQHIMAWPWKSKCICKSDFVFAGNIYKRPYAGMTNGMTRGCVYRARQPPSQEPVLYLNGDEQGIINNCTFLSNVAPSYAPPGQVVSCNFVS